MKWAWGVFYSTTLYRPVTPSVLQVHTLICRMRPISRFSMHFSWTSLGSVATADFSYSWAQKSVYSIFLVSMRDLVFNNYVSPCYAFSSTSQYVASLRSKIIFVGISIWPQSVRTRICNIYALAVLSFCVRACALMQLMAKDKERQDLMANYQQLAQEKDRLRASAEDFDKERGEMRWAQLLTRTSHDPEFWSALRLIQIRW